jgi:hypothetical protein
MHAASKVAGVEDPFVELLQKKPTHNAVVELN